MRIVFSVITGCLLALSACTKDSDSGAAVPADVATVEQGLLPASDGLAVPATETTGAAASSGAVDAAASLPSVGNVTVPSTESLGAGTVVLPSAQ